MKITDIDVDKILCVSVFSGRDEEDHDETEDDDDQGPENGQVGASDLPVEVDRDRNRPRDAQVVPSEEQRGAELAERTCEREHR